MNSRKKYIYPILLLFSALTISGSAAFYSVTGLSKIFAGEAFNVIIMAASLEFGKLVIAGALHRFWHDIGKLRYYLSFAIIVLILITSIGIYGFLSNAYQITSSQLEIQGKEIAVIESKLDRFKEQKLEVATEKSSLIHDIAGLQVSLSNPTQVQYVDKETGQLVTTASSSARRALQSELIDSKSRRDLLSSKIDILNDTITNLDIEIIEKESNSQASTDLGPLIYMSELTGWSMDKTVSLLILILILVFDPLAVALIIFFSIIIKKYETPIPEGILMPIPITPVAPIPKPLIKTEPVIFHSPAFPSNKIVTKPIIPPPPIIEKKIIKPTDDPEHELYYPRPPKLVPLTESEQRDMTQFQIDEYNQKKKDIDKLYEDKS